MPERRPEVTGRIERISEERLRAHVEALAGFGPRSIRDPRAARRTVEYLKEELSKYGYFPVEEEAPPDGPRDGPEKGPENGPENGIEEVDPTPFRNVLAEIRGTRNPETVVEIGAHHDTVPSSPGADDNSSGVAALLEAARVMAGARCRKTVRFCFFALEEAGRGGSRAHVGGMQARGERCEGILVLEMVGYATEAPGTQRTPARIPLLLWPPTTGNFITVVGNFSSGGIGNRFERAARRYVPALRYYSANRIGGFFRDASRSDHHSYWALGYRGVMLTDTANFRNPHYHQPSDLPDTLDYSFLRKVAMASAAAMLEWAEVE